MGLISTPMYGQMHSISETFAQIARMNVTLGAPRTLFAAVPEYAATHVGTAAAIDQAIDAVRALHLPFPGTARPTAAAIVDTGHGLAAIPIGIIRSGAGERVFGPVRLDTFGHALAAPSERITHTISNLVALVDESLVARFV